MRRRTFLTAIPFALAGCGPRSAPSPTAQEQARLAHETMLADYRVSANATRTTPRQELDVLQAYPELKPLVRVSLRLHPRYGEEPPADASKLGGQFLWPSEQAWPTCPEFRILMQPVLQLRAEDTPPQFPFRPGSDLFQLFWTPRATKAGPPHVIGVWRRRGEVGPQLMSTPEISGDLGYRPVPCRLFPERQAELPALSLMPKIMREKLIGRPQLPETIPPGTKVGGWPRDPDKLATCWNCVHPMDYVLTIASSEWTSETEGRWKPIEDRDEEGFRRAAGLDFGTPDAAMQIFLCKRCQEWPMRASVVQ